MIWIAGCSNGDTPGDPTLFNDGFKGITYTSSDDPTPIGSVDHDDWKSDGYWDWRYPIAPCRSIVIPFSKRTKIDTVIHTNFAMYPAYPNPFNPTTSIEFALPVTCHVYASIINDRYQTVQVLICEVLDAGLVEVEWSAVDSNNRELPSDIYRFLIRCTDDNGNLLFASHGDLWLKY